jgi:small-conductance mechanosensitive channel
MPVATFLQNNGREWLVAIALAAATVSVLLLARRLLVQRLGHRAAATRTDLDDLFVDLVRRTRGYFVLALGVAVGTLALALPPGPRRFVEVAVILASFLQAGVWGSAVITYIIDQYLRVKRDGDAAAATTVAAFGFLARLAFWVLIAFIALDNLGVDITALVAGLGVGGIAVALAVQNILGDLFASFSIVLDKPFLVGDFIVVGEHLGTVEHIGLKTTRVRSLSGEQIIFANGDLLSSRVRNYKRMAERRVLFTLGVTYDTAAEKLEAIPSMIRSIVERHPAARFDRAHFTGYGAYALEFEVVLYVPSPDFLVYRDVMQAINLEIFRGFAEVGIEFAFPTQTLLIARRSHAS